jgi:release factor glutamine methyltransferase
MNVGEALSRGRRLLAGTSDAPNRDASLLLSFVLGTPSEYVYLHPEAPINDTLLGEYAALLKRRAEGEPVAYLRGFQEFMGHAFLVDPRVLIPRPETEHVVETAVSLLSKTQSPLLADVCCGSGVVGLSIAMCLSGSKVVLSDVSREAVGLARKNAEKLGLTQRVTFLVGDLFEPLVAEGFAGKIDALTANPPYIPGDEVETLPIAQRKYEPRLALDGGEDGLLVIRRILKEANRVLKPGGYLVMEIGADQGEACLEMMTENGFWTDSHALSDYAGRQRVVVGRTRV